MDQISQFASVMIAKDVIEKINSGKYIAGRECFSEADEGKDESFNSSNGIQLLENCTYKVNVIAALYLSTNEYNGTVPDIKIDYDSMELYLDYLPFSDEEPICDFYYIQKNVCAKQCMIEIMENIIKNGGIFIWPKDAIQHPGY